MLRRIRQADRFCHSPKEFHGAAADCRRLASRLKKLQQDFSFDFLGAECAESLELSAKGLDWYGVFYTDRRRRTAVCWEVADLIDYVTAVTGRPHHAALADIL